jgi:hypothetical protein
MGNFETPDDGKSAPVKPTAASTPPNGEERRRIIKEYADALREFRDAIRAIWRKHTH